jgi:hypothetical protein
MGRCGSVAVRKSLADAGLNVMHIHRVQGDDINMGVERLEMEKDAGREIVVITLARDPVARNLSAYWLNYVSPVKPDPSLDHFLDSYPHDVPLTWMQEQLTYWDPEFELSKINSDGMWKDGYDQVGNIVFIRTRDLTRTFTAVMRKFEGPGDVFLSKFRNPVSRLEDYIDFIRDIDLPAWYLDGMYESDYAKTFFSPGEIKILHNIWRKR